VLYGSLILLLALAREEV